MRWWYTISKIIETIFDKLPIFSSHMTRIFHFESFSVPATKRAIIYLLNQENSVLPWLKFWCSTTRFDLWKKNILQIVAHFTLVRFQVVKLIFLQHLNLIRLIHSSDYYGYHSNIQFNRNILSQCLKNQLSILFPFSSKKIKSISLNLIQMSLVQRDKT